jgi:hypothetical protein
VDAAESARRLLERDATIFAGSTATRALGWLEHPRRVTEDLPRLEAQWHDDHPVRHVRTILIGMGGASSPGAMLAGLEGSGRLSVLDTSNPDSIALTDFHGVNVIAASKSGTTIETVTTLAWALSHGLSERDLTVITDPGSSLAQLAESLGAKIFYGDPRCGGRFSALSAFGLVPAIAAGWSAEELLATSMSTEPTLDQLTQWFAEGSHGSLVRDGIGWLELPSAPTSMSGSLWLEQLVAESTGKDGRGIVPVVGSASDGTPQRTSALRDAFAHHVRVSAMAQALGVDPFDQPDVEGAKRNVFSELARDDIVADASGVDAEGAAVLDAAGYVALQVYGPLEIEGSVESLRARLTRRFDKVTAGLGPRYLHSSGQLHKGGPDSVVALQVTVRPRSEPVRITGRSYSFHELHAAQARADARTLRELGRQVVTVTVDDLDEVGSALEV